MMAAVQPYISGAISKTINMPSTVTVEDVYNAYMEAWKKGLKSITIYRDDSKSFQPLTSTKAKVKVAKTDELQNLFERCDTYEKERFLKQVNGLLPIQPKRRKLPSDRTSTTHSFQISNFKGTLHVGFYPDTKKVGEIFITASKSGTTINGLLDCWAICFSYALQYGVPLSVLTRKFSFQRFEPEGWTSNPSINHAHSIIDYIARLLESQYNDDKASERDWLTPTVSSPTIQNVKDTYGDDVEVNEFDAPLCDRCGTLTRRCGACHTCPSCGDSTGCG
jgi:ribonucleoside-diphosphate reductase alpha chain